MWCNGDVLFQNMNVLLFCRVVFADIIPDLNLPLLLGHNHDSIFTPYVTVFSQCRA